MRKVGRILVIIGLVICLVPIAGHIYTQYRQKQLYQEYIEKQQIEDVGKIDDTKQVRSKEADENIKEREQQYTFEDGEVMGKIIIPSINLDLLLLEGESNANLKLGACHMQGTAYPGELGNCGVAGHRNYTFGSMFNRLDDVKIDDKISIEMNRATYDYKVVDSLIVEPTEINVLDQPTDKKEITLITCHPLYTGTHRLIIKGELIENAHE